MGMRNTTFTADDGAAPNPGNGAKSTAADLAKFLQMLLNGGKANGKQILSEAAVAEMRKVQINPEQIKTVFRGTEGFTFTLGTWTTDEGLATGSTATVLALPSFKGVWPAVDFARRYAVVILPGEFSGDQNPALYLELKKIIDPLVK